MRMESGLALLALALALTWVGGAEGDVGEVEQRDLACALQWSGWIGEGSERVERRGDFCWSREEVSITTVEEFIPCDRGRDEGENRILFIGDSLVRNLFVSFLEILDIPLSWQWDSYKGHRSFDVIVRRGEKRRAIVPFSSSPSLPQQETESNPMVWTVPEIEKAIVEMPQPACGALTLSFRWAPFVTNVTRLCREESIKGSSLVVDSGLWDLLHIHNEYMWRKNVGELIVLLSQAREIEKHVIWLTPGLLQRERMPTQEKKKYLTNESVERMIDAVRERFSVSHLSLRMLDLRRTMTFAESMESALALTTDGIHPPEEILRSVIPSLLAHWESERMEDIDGVLRKLPIIRLPPIQRVSESEREAEQAKEKASVPPPAKPSGFIGSDPLMGALVGLYFLLMFLTGDVLLVSRPLLWILEQ